MHSQNSNASYNLSFQWGLGSTFIVFLKIQYYEGQVYQKLISEEDVDYLGSVGFGVVLGFC
jgi:hypothetical protein